VLATWVSSINLFDRCARELCNMCAMDPQRGPHPSEKNDARHFLER